MRRQLSRFVEETLGSGRESFDPVHSSHFGPVVVPKWELGYASFNLQAASPV
jgi:hypothetical protein